MVLALVVLAVRASPTWTWIGLLLGVPATILLIIQAVMDSDALFPYCAALEAVLYFYATYGLIRYMLADHEITRDELFAVGATFTLVAWGFAYVFVVWQAIEPGSFTAAVDPEAQRTWMELLFLSFTTLSSTGLSDVIPIDPFARSLVMIEQLVGRRVHRGRRLAPGRAHDPAHAMKATIDGGFWAGRRRFNRDVLIPDGERQIREAGTFDNLRAAAAGRGTHRGLVYQDSDLHKWVEALGWELRNAPSPALQRMADEVTALLIAAQAPDGYLDTAFQVTGHERYRNLADEHEIYCMGHLIEAGLAHPPLLPVARRVADHLVATFTDRPGFCGHPEAELALVKLYRATGERAYLELARRFVERRGHGTLPQRYGSSAYLVDRVPVREQTVVEGHCVRQLYLNCGATDVFTELGEPLDPLLAAWEDMVDGKTYITGGVGSDRAHEAFGAPFEIAPASAYAETCAAIASVFWNWRLLQATGEVRFADLLERTLYNGVLVGVAFDRSAYSYWNTLHGTPDRRPWFDCACCPPNLMRLLASLHTYLATEDDGVLTIHQYATGTVGGARVRTTYPWEGRIEIDADRPVRLRVPAWSAHAQLNGRPVAPGYVDADPGHNTLDLDMRLRVIEADPRVPSIRGHVAFERGPFVLCLEEGNLVPYAFAERALRVWIPQKVSRQSVWAASRPSTASAPT